MLNLVTGGTGFLGSHLVTRLIENGEVVRILARKSSQLDHLPQKDIDVIYGDLMDKSSLRDVVKGVDIVYHAGATIRGTWQDIETSNVRGTEWMLEHSLDAGVKKFIHISSLSTYNVYGLKRNSLVDERCPIEQHPQKVGPYAHSKVEAEKLVLKYHKLGLPTVIVRPGIIYGPRGLILFPHIGYKIFGRFYGIVGNGSNILPLTYINNTIDALLLISQNEEAIGQSYTIVDNEPITQREYLYSFMAATNTKFLVLPLLFPILLHSVGLLELARDLGFIKKKYIPTKYGLVSKYNSLQFSSKKAHEELGWKPNVCLKDGLEKTFEWFNSHDIKN
jgi:2-alkyl-3-oxoalkanoate reductase